MDGVILGSPEHLVYILNDCCPYFGHIFNGIAMVGAVWFIWLGLKAIINWVY
jgi:hypothetical protein